MWLGQIVCFIIFCWTVYDLDIATLIGTSSVLVVTIWIMLLLDWQEQESSPIYVLSSYNVARNLVFKTPMCLFN